MLKKQVLSKKVTPHTLRHQFATDLLISGADLRAIQIFLGHKNIQTTQVYTHFTNRELKEIHQAFHGRRRRLKNKNRMRI
jgi:site-specific recombinase XerD